MTPHVTTRSRLRVRQGLIARTAPYMHDGSIATLKDVVEYHDRGGNPNRFLDAELRPLGLTGAEKQALIAF
jgi:cytochrome c peroxidase